MGTWAYQGIELFVDEQPTPLLDRIARLEMTGGRRGGFSAIAVFRAPILGSNPPRYNPKGQPRLFLHVAWHDASATCWPVLYYIAQRDRRAMLSSFSGVGFYARDIDRDGHPREPVLLACFNSAAEDFPEPLRPGYPTDAEWAAQQTDRHQQIDRLAARLQASGNNPARIVEAKRLVLAGAVRFDNGWFLRDGTWMSRYLVQRPGDVAIATAQKSLCTCASRHPESLQLVMPSDNCVHFLAARLAEYLAEEAMSR